jgi:hypothetical protein
MHTTSDNGKYEAWLEAWTELKDGQFSYQIVSERGSDMARGKVLRPMLAREQELVNNGDGRKSELTSENYEFTEAGRDDDGARVVHIKPRRQDPLLVEGRAVLNDGGDLLRVEGKLSKNPSFWTSLVNIVRRYARIGGVRVPVANLLGGENEGFAVAQARLGPGRIHHCMRTIGQCELAVDLMCERALTRRAFGKHLSDYANVQDWIAHSRVEIDQARLLVLQAAWKMDTFGNKAAHLDVSAIKLVAAQLQTRVVDRAMQVFGAMGLTPDTPLSSLWSWGRAMRFFDGPDEVHLRSIARAELARAKGQLGSTAAYYYYPAS